ncbi:MAG: nucleotide exchange factor GrpE [Candidatus Jordarchaeaceae archaeon]
MAESEKKNEETESERSTNELKAKNEAEDVELLKKALEEEKKRADDYLNRLKYLQADFENYMKRMEKERGEILKREKTRLISRLLVILDELELAIKNGKNAQDKNILVEGVEMVFNKFQKLLCEEGLCEIEALGKPFNPELHEAALVVQTDAHPNNTVIEELRKGFMINGKVVRPSSVKVAKRPSVDAKPDESNKN